jgi:hypothetical protein
MVADYVVTPAEYAEFETEKLFAVDALFQRYISLVSVMQDRLFKSIAVVEQEEAHGPSRRDLTVLMEKLGRPTLQREHDREKHSGAYCLSRVDDRVERLNETLRNAVFLVQAFNEALDFVVHRRLLPVHPLTGLDHIVLWRRTRTPLSPNKTGGSRRTVRRRAGILRRIPHGNPGSRVSKHSESLERPGRGWIDSAGREKKRGLCSSASRPPRRGCASGRKRPMSV